jgi:predicted RNA binding protein YcfA (HicA-like mRNA interferase family)
MPHLRVLSGKDVCKILAQNGFEEVRRKGSHIIMQKRQRNSTLTIPVPDHAELKMGTLLGIIRQSGLPRTLFETR